MLLVGVLIGFLYLGYWRTSVISYHPTLTEFYDREIYLIGKIISEPDRRAKNVRYVLNIKQAIFPIASPSHGQNNFLTYGHGINYQKNLHLKNRREKALIYLPLNSEYEMGQILKIKGQLRQPENFETDTGGEFDYVNFLAKDQIYYLMKFASSDILKDSDYVFLTKIFAFKKYFLNQIDRILSPPHSDLMSGLLLGDRSTLDEEIEENFRITGLVHVIVFSGFHVGLIVFLILKILIFLPTYLKYSAGILTVIILALLVGLSATVIRASIMVIVVMVSKMSGRNYQINRSLCLTGLIMLIHNPLILLHDLSFRLSFLATFGIVNFTKKIYQKLNFITERFKIRAIMTTTIAAQLSVTPVLIGMSGYISIIALPANLLILPLIPLTIISGFVMVILVTLFYPIGLLFSLVPYNLLDSQLRLVEFFSGFTFSTIRVSSLTPWQIFLFYSLAVIFLNDSPIKIFKKVFNVLAFSARLIISHK